MTDRKVGAILVTIAITVALILIVSGNDAGSAIEVGLLK